MQKLILLQPALNLVKFCADMQFVKIHKHCGSARNGEEVWQVEMGVEIEQE
jgi:hypothetical protein